MEAMVMGETMKLGKDDLALTLKELEAQRLTLLLSLNLLDIGVRGLRAQVKRCGKE